MNTVNTLNAVNKAEKTNLERYLRLIAGAFVVLSVGLGHWVSPCWSLM